MADVISIAEYKDNRPVPHNEKWGQGVAVCGACHHEWEATAPIGTFDMECPKCHVARGMFKYEYDVQVGDSKWVCTCGNYYFYITPDGIKCPGCGWYQEL